MNRAKSPPKNRLTISAAIAVGLGISAAYGQSNFDQSLLQRIGDTPIEVVSSDLNSDGVVDLITPVFFSNQINVYMGNGDGTFADASVLNTVGTPQGVRVADLNNDGHEDLVVIHGFQGILSVFFGEGDGSFSTPSNSLFFDEIGYIELADIDNDGWVDIIGSQGAAGRTIALINNQSGGFGAPLTIGNVGASALASGDINFDGRVDFVMVNLFNPEFLLYVGNGDGTFDEPLSFPTGNGPLGVHFEDLSGDGTLDVVTANLIDNSVTVSTAFVFNGDISFSLPTDYPVGVGPIDIDTADFDNDGVSDLVVTNSEDGDVSILHGAGFGTFSDQVRFSAGGEGTRGVTANDFNNDGFADFAVANSLSESIALFTNSAEVTVCRVDINGDGLLNFFDVSVFIQEFNAGNPSVDFTDDGELNFFDISTFISEFASGCP